MAGDHSLRRFSVSGDHIARLADRLARDYPLDHEVIAYEAATLPIHRPRIEPVPLRSMRDCTWRLQTTLVVPPASARELDTETVEALAETQRRSAVPLTDMSTTPGE